MSLSEEQKQQRVAKFCCSSIHKLMGAKGIGKTGETYIYEVAAEIMTGQPVKEEFSSAATQWGNDNEFLAKKYFETATCLRISECNTKDNGLITGTPDGFIECENSGFEIKCPYNSGNHLKNLLLASPVDLLDLRPEYFWQIYGYFWIFGFEKFRFCSYDPRFKEEKRMLILNIPKEQVYLEQLKKRVTEANLMLQNILSKI
jgi:hypothetical protein